MNSMAWKLAKWAKFQQVVMKTNMVKKIKNLREQNFKGEANNKQLDSEDTQQSDFSS